MSMPTLPDLIDDAWSMHRRDPAMLVALGLQIVEAAGEGTASAGVGWLQVAWGRRYRGERDDARLALQRAQQLAEDHGDAALAADARDLQAMVLQMAGRHDEALALLALNDAMPSGARRPDARVRTRLRRADVFSAQGRLDDALRERYAALAEARDSGHHGSDLSLVAQALQLVGGTLGMLENPEQAEALCAEAAELADRADAFYTWASAALNRMNALVTLERADEALPLAERLLAIEPRLHPNGREQRLIVYADACQQAGQWERAQALLDDSVALRSEMGRSLRSWTVAHDLGTDPAQMPSEDLRLMLALAVPARRWASCPLRWPWSAAPCDLHENLVGRSARASRLALEVEHQLASERRQRSQAEAEQQRLDAMNQALQAASAAKTRFLAAASHDLRQPVQALALNMAALEQEDVTPVQAQLVQRMGRSLQALGQMFDVLLDISRLDAGIVPVAAQPLDLRPLLLRLRDDVAATAGARGLQVRLHLPWTRPQAATGAPHRSQAVPSSATR
jgi:tetratricopeptide (TPR) repeat protein